MKHTATRKLVLTAMMACLAFVLNTFVYFPAMVPQRHAYTGHYNKKQTAVILYYIKKNRGVSGYHIKHLKVKNCMNDYNTQYTKSAKSI